MSAVKNALPSMETISPASQWQAYLTLGFTKSVRGTVLKTCDHKGPLYVQKPFYPEGKDTAHVYLLHPPGGLVSGDELVIESNQAPDTHVLITTPGAGRVYKARSDRTLQRQTTRLNVPKDAIMEWLPQETILYPDANTRLRNQIELYGSARFIGWEITCFGLPANQLDFGTGHADQSFQIRVDGRLRLRERLLVDEHSRGLMAGKAGLQGNPVNGLLLAGPFVKVEEDVIETLRSFCQESDGLSGVTQVDEFIVLRSLSHDSEKMKRLFARCWEVLRPALIDKTACAPRIWAT
ncbi:urease accessory protein UreD [Marinomonas fungiae]|uniref:Urease accessory protein UreD n=1 Tax=Marinomonas fungiae TaxID=1137284 RepID=A0A0K6ILX3_9GAMM|nr:urease accessory protein UreD [Marinomonas fungiae]CUB04110.1 Urease accessory protein UreH [Marinomonas fungiae]